MRTIKDYMLEAQELDDQGKYAEAVELMDKVIERDNKFEGAYINRGAYKSSLGDYRGAIDDYFKALSIEPKNTKALLNIANNYDRLEKYDLALEYYNKAFESKGGETVIIDIVSDTQSNVSRGELHL